MPATEAARKRHLATRKVLRGATADSVRAVADRLIAAGEGRTVAHRLIKQYREKFYPSIPSTHAAERIADDMRGWHRMGASTKATEMAAIVSIRRDAGVQSYLSARSIQAILANPQI